MSASVDLRGVKRGSCTEDACRCSGYVRGSGGNLKCVWCNHVPGKHCNLGPGTRDVGVSSLLNPSTSTSHGVSLLITGAHQTTPLSETSLRVGSNVHMYSGSGRMLPHQPAATEEDKNTHVTTMHKKLPPRLPQCQANGCTKPVFYDPELPEELATDFAYCSPRCRDGDLLPVHSAKLTGDLKELKKELQGIVAAEKSVKPKSPSRVTSTSSSHATYASVTNETGRQSGDVTTVLIPCSTHKPFGLILSQKPHNSDKAIGFMIAGVVRDSPAAKAMENNKLTIFDVIITVNSKKCNDMLTRKRTPQECFDQEIASAKEVKLFVNHSFAIQSLSSTLSNASWSHPLSTHVIVMRYSPESKDATFGLSLTDTQFRVLVGGVSADTPARLCGVEYSDEICMYALVSKGKIGRGNSVFTLKDDSEKDIKKAYKEGKSVLLIVKRTRVTKHNMVSYC